MNWTENDNRSLKKSPSVLFVLPDAFHQGWMGATRRLLLFAKAFRELGFNVGLLAGKMTNREQQSRIDQQFPGLIFRTEHTGAYPRSVDTSARCRRAWRGLWKLRGSDYYAEQLSCGWGSTLNLDGVIEQFRSKSFSPDLLWGISGGYLAGGTAADRLAGRLNMPWILELRDPPRECGIDQKRPVICAEFCRLLRSASRVVVTTESYRRHLIENFSLDTQSVKVIYGLLEDGLKNLDKTEWRSQWCIGYVGTLNGGRNLNPLAKGFRIALDRQPQMLDTSFIVIAGEGPGVIETKKLAESIGLENNVRLLGYIPKVEVYKLIQSTGVLVVVQTASTSHFQIPGKLFEYMSCGKPLIGIMPLDCEAANILRHSGLGFVHSEADINGIADTLVRLWTDWAAKRPSVEINHSYISQFSAESLPDKLRSVLIGVK